MFCWISIFAGLLIMMGHQARSEALFYYLRLEDQVPENHLLRLIDKHVSFEFVRQQLKDSYSETGKQLFKIAKAGKKESSGYEPEGREFESLRAHHLLSATQALSCLCDAA